VLKKWLAIHTNTTPLPQFNFSAQVHNWNAWRDDNVIGFWCVLRNPSSGPHI
jgi:hypothetical protein